MKIRLMVVDDHLCVLEGTKNLLAGIEGFTVDATDDIYSIHKMLEEQKIVYDVFLIDINMPNQNGIVLCSKVRSSLPSAKVILYTGDNIEDYYSLVLDKMVHGILSKTASKDQVVSTIRSAVRGDVLLPSSFIDFVKDYYQVGESEESLKLNEREQLILHYLALGYSNSVIAGELQVSQRTIERNLAQIYNLLNVSTRSEAVMVARERNLFL